MHATPAMEMPHAIRMNAVTLGGFARAVAAVGALAPGDLRLIVTQTYTENAPKGQAPAWRRFGVATCF